MGILRNTGEKLRLVRFGSASEGVFRTKTSSAAGPQFPLEEVDLGHWLSTDQESGRAAQKAAI